MGPVSQPPACMLRYGHSSDPIMPHPILVLLILLSILFECRSGVGAGQGQRQPETAAAVGQSQ